MTGSSTEKRTPQWNKLLQFGPIKEEEFSKAGEVVIELISNNKKVSEVILQMDEIPLEQESDSRPYPLVNSKGTHSGLVHLKMWLERCA